MSQKVISASEIPRLRGVVENYRNQERWGDMAELQLKILHSQKARLGNEHSDTLGTMHDLANTYGRMGRLMDAAELYRPLADARRRLLGQEHPTTIITMHYLAVTYTDMGQLKEAEALHRQILPIRKRLLGPEHPDTLRSMLYLAVTCGDLGKLTDARDIYEELLPIRRRGLGTRDPATIQVMNNLAVTYTDLGQNQEAVELHRELLAIRRGSPKYGNEHRDTLRTMHYLAVTYGNMGRLEEAAELHAELLPLRQRLLGPENPATLTTMSHLAVTYTDLERFHDAEKLHVQLLQIQKRLLGPEHKDTLRSSYYLAVAYIGLEELTEAEELLTKTLPTYDKVFGRDHSYSMGSLGNLASISARQGRWKDAEKHESELLERRKSFLGNSHASTLVSIKSLSVIYQQQRRWRESNELEESISQPSQVSSASLSDWQTAASRTPESTKYITAEIGQTGSLQEADAVALGRMLGSEHPESLDSMEYNAVSHLSNKRWAEAEAILTNVLMFRREVQGDGHLFTIQTMSNLGWAYQGQGKIVDAVEMFRSALKELDQNHATGETNLRSDIESRLSFTYGKVESAGGSSIPRATVQEPTSSGHTLHNLQNPREVITSSTTIEEIMACLTTRKCPDLTRSLNEAQCSRRAVKSGGFGDVWRGVLLDGSIVALKSLWRGDKLTKHLARELYAWSKTQHENVLALSGLAYFKNQLVMVSPWMEYGNINEYLQQHPNVDRLGMIAQVVEGVAYLHRIPLIHGDIKAQNIFVSHDGIIKVGDFGLATLLGEQSLGFSTTTAPLLGTYRWTAPELFGGSHGSTTLESDAYALGMTILEIITGKIPFWELESLQQVLAAILVEQKRPALPQEIVSMGEEGTRLWGLLNRCWDTEPSKRPTAEQVLKEVKEIMG